MSKVNFNLVMLAILLGFVILGCGIGALAKPVLPNIPAYPATLAYRGDHYELRVIVPPNTDIGTDVAQINAYLDALVGNSVELHVCMDSEQNPFRGYVCTEFWLPK